MRANARMLLTLDEKSQKRIFEGNALLRRCVRLGLLEEDKRELDYVLAIKVGDIMARRLQTLVFKQNLAKSLHHARVLIRQRHIRVKSQMVNIPSFLVRVEQVSSNRGVSREWVPGMGRGSPLWTSGVGPARLSSWPRRWESSRRCDARRRSSWMNRVMLI